LIGRKYDDKDVQADMKHFPFKVVNKSGSPRVQVDVSGEAKTFTPEEVWQTYADKQEVAN